MRSTIYNPAQAARVADAKAIRRRVRALQAPALARFNNGPQVAAELATGTIATIGNHMLRFGADSELCRRYASQAGKRVKAAYMARTGTAPRKVWTVRNGRAIEVFAYAADDAAVAAGFASYAQTAHLVAA
ncbi:hypothetical protein [Nocardia miyunensis]|uniref:hypothetical protein n=1 Tax=Nocardia miyunensis TaxID=282684 RepID=UPI00083129D1|nr:hypothetical protein [Nocardia miyunensis]